MQRDGAEEGKRPMPWRPCLTNSTPSPLTSSALSFSTKTQHTLQRACSLMSVAKSWMLCALLTLTLVTGCCSSPRRNIPLAPRLPPGQPPTSLRSKLLETQQSWQYNSGNVLLTNSDIDMLLLYGAEWRAWALALKTGGNWRK